MAKTETNGNTRKQTRAANGAGYLVLRGGRWEARWKVNGKIIARSLKTTDRKTAELKLAQISAPRENLRDREALRKIALVMAARMDDVNDQVKIAAIPVSSLFELWLQSPVRGNATGRTLDSYRIQLKSFETWLNQRYPDITNARDISQSIADDYIAHRREARSSGTVSKDLNLLAAVWRAISLKYGVDYNPWTQDKIARPSGRINTRRQLTEDECSKILDAATPLQRLRVLLGLDAGLRLGDVIRLQWSDIDFSRGLIVRETQKTGATVYNPISDRLLDALLARRGEIPDGQPLVFPEDVARLKANGNSENISREMTRLFERAGIATSKDGTTGKRISVASFHSLRHTFVSRLMERGVNPYYVQRAVGHSTMAMTAHYDHSAAEAIKDALTRDPR